MIKDKFMIIECAKCRKPMEFQHTKELPYFPFCSKQCKLIDLGRWLDESHKLPNYSEEKPDSWIVNNDEDE